MPAFGERFRQKVEVLGGEYIILPQYKSSGALIAEVYHVRSNDEEFGQVLTPVARLLAFVHSGEIDDWSNPHWEIHLLIRSEVPYEEKSRTTTVVGDPAGQAGRNKDLLNRLLALRDSDLPCVHPELAHALGNGLIKANLCSEPASLHIHFAKEESFIRFGKVVADQDD